MLLIYIVVFIVIVVFYWFVAKEFYKIAKMKGHPQKKYFWWCFWVSWFGYMMVIALPDKRSTQTQNIPSIDELPELQGGKRENERTIFKTVCPAPKFIFRVRPCFDCSRGFAQR